MQVLFSIVFFIVSIIILILIRPTVGANTPSSAQDFYHHINLEIYTHNMGDYYLGNK